jgi:tetratricopeptide (TPR) repeat protein
MLVRWGFAAVLSVLIAGAASAVGNDNSSLHNDPGYKRASELVKAEKWQEALPVLLDLEKDIKNAADVYNLLGIVYRKLKDYPTSKRHYDRALQIDPEHLPTLEYQGEWFLETGDVASARANFEKMKRICLYCHETADLEAALKRHGVALN